MGEATWRVLLRARRLLRAEQFEQARALLADRANELAASRGFVSRSLYGAVYWQLDRALRDRGLEAAQTLTEALTLLIENPVITAVPLRFQSGLTPLAILGVGVVFAVLAIDLAASGPLWRNVVPVVALLGVLFVVPRRPVTRLLITKRSFGYAGVGAPMASVAEVRSGTRRVTAHLSEPLRQSVVVITLHDGQKREVLEAMPWAARQALLEAGVNAVYTSDPI
jgi:hypothetical protein